jgi:hypothetical protein
MRRIGLRRSLTTVTDPESDQFRTRSPGTVKVRRSKYPQACNCTDGQTHATFCETKPNLVMQIVMDNPFTANKKLGHQPRSTQPPVRYASRAATRPRGIAKKAGGLTLWLATKARISSSPCAGVSLQPPAVNWLLATPRISPKFHRIERGARQSKVCGSRTVWGGGFDRRPARLARLFAPVGWRGLVQVKKPFRFRRTQDKLT